jgi:hypothetical protein
MTAFLQVIERQGGLVRYDPIFKDPDDDEPRCVLLRPTVMSTIDLEKSQILENKLVGIHGQLGAFVRGDKLTISVPDRGGTDGDLKGLKPITNCVWQMRFREPMEYRILGVIPEKNVFLGLVIQPRKGLHWAKSVAETLSIWRSWRSPLAEKPNLIPSGAPEEAFTNWRLA